MSIALRASSASQLHAMSSSKVEETTPQGASRRVLPYGPSLSEMRCQHAPSAFGDEGWLSGKSVGITAAFVHAGNPLPPVVHAKADPKGRIIVVGDVHGCLHELKVGSDLS